MPLEVATFIDQLDASWPLGGDSVNKGDDHLRLVKSVLQAQFPGVDGDGFKKAITATEDDLNNLTGSTSNIQVQLDDHESRIVKNELDIADLQSNLNAEPGTVMVFYQAAAPTGWTQDTSKNDFMMRTVAGAGGGSGGSVSPITLSHNHATKSHTLTNGEMPTHTHRNGIADGTDVAFVYGGTAIDMPGSASQGMETNSGNNARQGRTSENGSSNGHDHGNTENNTVSVKYVNTILCIKD